MRAVRAVREGCKEEFLEIFSSCSSGWFLHPSSQNLSSGSLVFDHSSLTVCLVTESPVNMSPIFKSVVC